MHDEHRGQLLRNLSWQILGEDVCDVILGFDFEDFDLPVLNQVLKIQLRRLNMTRFRPGPDLVTNDLADELSV